LYRCGIRTGRRLQTFSADDDVIAVGGGLC